MFFPTLQPVIKPLTRQPSLGWQAVTHFLIILDTPKQDVTGMEPRRELFDYHASQR